jgi:predicted nucleic acid-binding protein
MRVYIESTIPSYVVARPARDLLQTARQQITRDWWEGERRRHQLFTSQVVIDEISAGEKEMADRRLNLMAGIPLLDMLPTAEELVEQFLRSAILPPHAAGDAAHIALAIVHRLDILLTWNCRHIANAAIELRVKQLIEPQRLVLPLICTPEELFEHGYE